MVQKRPTSNIFTTVFFFHVREHYRYLELPCQVNSTRINKDNENRCYLLRSWKTVFVAFFSLSVLALLTRARHLFWQGKPISARHQQCFCKLFSFRQSTRQRDTLLTIHHVQVRRRRQKTVWVNFIELISTNISTARKRKNWQFSNWKSGY